MQLVKCIRKDVEEREGLRVVSRLVVIASGLYLAYIGLTCPCKTLYSCHLKEMNIALAVILAVLISHNGLRFSSY